MQLKTVDLSQNSQRKILLKSAVFTRILESWIEINVPVSDVWQALTDVESWDKWNSFIPVVEGKLAVGNVINPDSTSPNQ